MIQSSHITEIHSVWILFCVKRNQKGKHKYSDTNHWLIHTTTTKTPHSYIRSCENWTDRHSCCSYRSIVYTVYTPNGLLVRNLVATGEYASEIHFPITYAQVLIFSAVLPQMTGCRMPVLMSYHPTYVELMWVRLWVFLAAVIQNISSPGFMCLKCQPLIWVTWQYFL